MSLLTRRRKRRADLSLGTVVALVQGIPRFGLLLVRLMRDSRVSRLDRALLGFALVYLFFPSDLLPDWVPGMGWLDDLVVVTLALYRLLHRVDTDVMLEHWDGEIDPLLMLEDLLERAIGATPWWTRRLVRAG